MKRNTQTELNNIIQNRYAPYLLILLSVVLFNLIAVFGLDVLLMEDQHMYWQVTQGHFHRVLLNRSFVGPFISWGAHVIMVQSPHLIRGIYVIFLMVPLSCLFYYLYVNKLSLPNLPALTAAVLPNILPNQLYIPTCINGSYVVHGLVFSLASLYFGFKYLEDKHKKSWRWLMVAFSAYFVANQSMGEHGVFLFPCFAVAFLGYTEPGRKHFLLIGSFLATVVFKVYWTLFVYNVPPNQPVRLGFIEILVRMGAYAKWALPVSISNKWVPLGSVVFLSIIGLGFLLYIRRDGVVFHSNTALSRFSPKRHVVYVYMFALIWAISTSFPFVFVTRYVGVRLFYISYFGLYVLFVLSLHRIFDRPVFRKLKLHIVVLVFLIMVSGVSRYSNLKEDYSLKNQQSSIMKNELQRRELPRNSQVVIISSVIDPETGGWWARGTGYLQFITKRKDVTGLIGREYSCYDPFDVNRRGYDANCRMNGLSLKLPLFLFRMPKEKGSLVQLEHALQWKGETENAKWTIYNSDTKTGEITPLVSGQGWKEYNSTVGKLSQKGIQECDILWNCHCRRKELEKDKRGKRG